MPQLTAAVLSLSIALCAFPDTALALTSAPRRIPRLRPATPAAGRVMDHALRDSPTVRALASEIESSDLIVYVDIGHVDGRARATTVLVTATPHGRFVRITLPALTPLQDLIPLLAHEMQHAVEIAREPAVRDAASLRAFYTRIGTDPAADHTFETAGARLTEREARKDLRRPRLVR